jgi:hypothetical protein
MRATAAAANARPTTEAPAMSRTASYRASRIKRHRATKADMAARREALFDIIAEQQPMTVRQVFYQATVRGVIEKTEGGYAKVQNLLADMRRAGELPYQWLADNTRWMRKPTTFSGPREALLRTARLYRKALWDDINAYVEVWLEKDALAGVVVDVTATYDVPLMVSRGYASLSFLHSAAENMQEQERPCFIYHFGDFDPSGVNAAEKIEETLNELAPSAEIYFVRIAVTPEQIALWSLPTRPTKASDSRAKSWGGGEESVELDAIEPDTLRALVQACIEEHLPETELERLREVETAERESMLKFVEGWKAAAE